MPQLFPQESRVHEPDTHVTRRDLVVTTILMLSLVACAGFLGSTHNEHLRHRHPNAVHLRGLDVTNKGSLPCSATATEQDFEAHIKCIGLASPNAEIMRRASAPVVQPLAFAPAINDDDSAAWEKVADLASPPPPESAAEVLEDEVTLIVKHMSQFRSPHMADLHASIRHFYPRVRVIVGDDTAWHLSALPEWAVADNRTEYIALPPDCGLALGRNILVQLVKTRYLVLLDDDYVFTKYTRIELLLETMLANPGVAVVGGGLLKDQNDPESGYESYGLDITTLDLDTGTVEFQPSQTPLDSLGVRDVDAVVNFFLADTTILQRYRWQPALKMGEHEVFFLGLKLNKQKVLERPGVHILHDFARRSENYQLHSHRKDIALFASPACDASPGLNVLRSLWWSIVCDHQVFCLRDPTNPKTDVRCTESIHKPPSVEGRGVVHQDTRPSLLTHGEALLAPPVPADPATAIEADIFVAVITHQGNSETRMAFRTYFDTIASQRPEGSPRVQLRFFVGDRDVRDQCADWCEEHPEPWESKCAWDSHSCSACRGCGRMLLEDEQRAHGDDVVVLDATDFYTNLANKVTATMRWVSQHVRAKYVVKLDDDVFLNPVLLWARLQELQAPTVRFFAGNTVPTGYPSVRDPWHKWYLPLAQYPMWGLPRYNNGPCYVVSMDVASYLGRYKDITAAHPFNLEDVFMGVALTEMDVFARSLYQSEVRNSSGSVRPTRAQPFLLHLQNQKKYNAVTMAQTIAVHPIKHPHTSFPLLAGVVTQKLPAKEDPNYPVWLAGNNLKLLRVRKAEESAMQEIDKLNAWADKVAGKKYEGIYPDDH